MAPTGQANSDGLHVGTKVARLVSVSVSPPRLLALALLVCGGATGCTSRTVPLPPPEVTTVSAPDPSGLVAVSGWALEEASVGVFNEDTERGVVVPAEGEDCDRRCPFEARLAASPGDTLRVWQFTNTDNSIFSTVPPVADDP